MKQIISDVLQQHVSLECDNCIDGNHIEIVASDIEQALCQADVGRSSSSIKELYIITDEDGKHYVADNFTEADAEAVEDGLMTIIRCSDGKQLAEGGSWEELPKADW